VSCLTTVASVSAFFIASSVSSNIYLLPTVCPVSCVLFDNVASVSGFFIASSVSSNFYLLPTVCPVSCVLFDKCC
jgi:hypothetical protein